MEFKSLHIIQPILEALEEEGYTHPTPIQEKSIPILLEGNDLLGTAQTGTGKTAAFSIPILQLLSLDENKTRKKKIRSLILTPTRELAIQIDESLKTYGRHLDLKTTVIFGGVNQFSQVNALKQGVDILVATPGRLLDLMNQGFIDLKQLEIFVLDEADRMLDMGFIHDVKKTIAALPVKRQTLFFSATMPLQVSALAKSILKNPKHVEVTPVSSTADTINQFLYYTDKSKKIGLLLHLLKNENIISALVFTRTKHGADRIAGALGRTGIKADAIHGNKAQNARQKALNNFKDGHIRVLVATDIAARGIDVDDLEYVFNYDIPNEPETYVHRIGRTGRAGANGVSISFSDALEKEYIKDIEKLIKKRIPVVDNHPFPLEDHNPVKPPQKGQRPQNSNKSSNKKPTGNSNGKKPSGNQWRGGSGSGKPKSFRSKKK